jgi:16S rRNA (guanine966-N2)-methyltransferase
VRIIAGQFRRRKLLANTGLTTRPITDRAKEQLFENLGGELHGERVADIFSGTGSLGLEALSRGASRVVCIEKDRRGFELLKQNVATLGAEDRVFCWKADVFRCSFQPKGISGYLPFDLIFFDPPFPLLKKLKAGSPMYAALERLARDTISAPDALMILRVPTHPEYEMPDDWRLDWTLPLSNMEMHAYRKAEFRPAADSAESE